MVVTSSEDQRDVEVFVIHKSQKKKVRLFAHHYSVKPKLNVKGLLINVTWRKVHEGTVGISNNHSIDKFSRSNKITN